MKRMGWTATLTTFVLVLAGCRPTGPEPSRSVPPSQPAVEAPASQPDVEPGPAGPFGTAAGQAGRAGPPAKDGPGAGRTWSYTPKTSEGRVLGAIGKAVLRSVGGDAEPPREEAPRFGP